MSNAAPIDLATMLIADKVSRYTQGRYFAAQLGALQSEAERCSCHFVIADHLDHMPADIKEDPFPALMLARSAYLPPTERIGNRRACALARVADGSGQAVLRCS